MASQYPWEISLDQPAKNVLKDAKAYLFTLQNLGSISVTESEAHLNSLTQELLENKAYYDAKYPGYLDYLHNVLFSDSKNTCVEKTKHVPERKKEHEKLISDPRVLMSDPQNLMGDPQKLKNKGLGLLFKEKPKIKGDSMLPKYLTVDQSVLLYKDLLNYVQNTEIKRKIEADFLEEYLAGKKKVLFLAKVCDQLLPLNLVYQFSN